MLGSVVTRRSRQGVAAVAGVLAASGLVFVAAAGGTAAPVARAGSLTPPDMRMVVPKGGISVGVDSGQTFLRFSHVTSDFGPGPFELDPHYNSQTGVATFTQALYRSPSPGRWRFDHRVPVAAIGVFSPPFDYEFPLTSFTLLNTNGRIVATSPKTDYCITADFRLDHVRNTPAHSFIPQSNCTDPTKPLGWSVGFGDKYDQTDEGQPIDVTGVSDGTYTLRGIVDPRHVLTEKNKTNDVTDTEVTLTGIGTGTPSVTVGAQSRPDIPLPTVKITAPAPGRHVSGTVRLKATASTRQGHVTSVQFLVDGRPVGSPDTSAPYQRRWQTGAAALGKHLVSARVTTSKGMMNTAHSVPVVVAASLGTVDRAAPTVHLLNPVAGERVSGTVPVAAHVTDDVGVQRVRYFVDGDPIGVARRAPYAIRWNTRDQATGGHTVSAQVVDRAGRRSTTQQDVQVQNPAPSMTCYVVQKVLQAQGMRRVSTPAFRTAGPDEVLLALVSANGAAGVHQRTTVHGGGLTWHLVQRADAQPGDAEAWTAKVHAVRRVGPVTSRLSLGGHPQRLTVVALGGLEEIGAASGASGPSGKPQTSLVTTGEASSLVFAVGSAGVAQRPVLPTGQVVLSRSVDPAGGHTFWSQYTNEAVSPAGTSVTMRVLRPASAPWNFAAVEAVGEDE